MIEVAAAEFGGGAGLSFAELNPLPFGVANPDVGVVADTLLLASGARPVFHKGIKAIELGLGVRTAEGGQELPLAAINANVGRENRTRPVLLHAQQERVGFIVLPRVFPVAVATRAFVVERVGFHVIALGEHAHDGVL